MKAVIMVEIQTNFPVTARRTLHDLCKWMKDSAVIEDYSLPVEPTEVTDK